MDKKLILVIVVGILLIGIISSANGNESAYLTEMKENKGFLLNAVDWIINLFSGEDIQLRDMKATGMKISSIEVNEISVDELDYKSLEFNLKNQFTKDKGKWQMNSIKQEIYITNNLDYETTYNVSTITEINYNKVRWAGDSYYLNATPLKLESWYENETFIVPNIFYDDVYNKRINYRGEAKFGGYALVYEKNGSYFVEVRVDNLKLKPKEEFFLDPTYSNETTGFSTQNGIGGANIYGEQGNFTRYYHLDQSDRAVYVTDNTGVNQSSEGFRLDTMTSMQGMCGNISDLLIGNNTGGVHRYKKTGVLQLGTFLTPALQGVACNSTIGPISDVWITVNSGLSVNHYRNGVNQTDGCTFPTGISNAQGLLVDVNGTEYWTFDTTDLAINHTNSDCSIFAGDEGFDVSAFGMAGGVRAFTGVGNHFRINDLTDDFLYDILCTGVGCPDFGGGAPPDNEPEVTLNIPINNTNSSSANIIFNCSARDDQLIENLSLFINGTRTGTEYDGVDNITSLQIPQTLGEGNYNWTCEAYDNSTALQVDWGGNQTFAVDLTDPTIVLVSNLTNLSTTSLPINSTWHYNVTDFHLASCYWNTTDDATLNILTNCNDSIMTGWTTRGGKRVYRYANDSAGNEIYEITNLTVYFLNWTQASNKTTITEGQDAFFNLSINMSGGISSTTAYLWYNNTKYSASSVQGGANQYNFSTTITIPTTAGSATGTTVKWFWEYDILNRIKANTSEVDQTVYSIELGNCSVFGAVVANFTLKDEETTNVISKTLNNTMEIEATLRGSTVSIKYNQTISNHTGFALCVPPALLEDTSTTYYLDFVTKYLANTYVEEFYYMDNEIIMNSTVPYYYNLMDLLTADSQSFVVSFIGENGLLQEDAIINLMRKYIGDTEYRIVEAGKTDDDGETIMHFVEEDVIYKFNVSKNGEWIWTSQDVRVYCASAPCTIELDANGVVQQVTHDWDSLPEGSYSLSSNQTTRQVSLVFNLNESHEMNLTIYAYSNNISIASTPVVSGVLEASSGTITVTVPLSYGNSTYYGVIYEDASWVNSHWISLKERAQTYFDGWVTFLVAMIVLTLGLMTISTGAPMLIFAVLGFVMASLLQILDLSYTILIYIICVAVIIIIKIIQRRGE